MIPRARRAERVALGIQEAGYAVSRALNAGTYGLYRAASAAGDVIADAGEHVAHGILLGADVAHGLRVGLTPAEALGNARGDEPTQRQEKGPRD